MPAQVVAVRAQARPIEESLSFVGSLAANEFVEIRSEIDGVIEQIGFEEGQAVKEGSILFRFDQSKLEASLAQAQANLKLAESTQARYEGLVETGAVSRQELDSALSNFESGKAAVQLLGEQLADATLAAAFDGIVGARQVSKGQYVTRGTPLTTLINPDPIKAQFQVPERYLGELAAGQSVKARVAAYPDQEFTGKIFFVAPEVDEATRTVMVKAVVANSQGLLRQGMFAQIGWVAELRQKAIVIPETALAIQGDSVSVYVVDAEGTAQPRAVSIGIRLAGEVEILSGLLASDVVITEGLQKIGPGAKVVVRYAQGDDAAL
jgi:membrane fusion protein (multidrug efflux system)